MNHIDVFQNYFGSKKRVSSKEIQSDSQSTSSRSRYIIDRILREKSSTCHHQVLRIVTFI